MRRQDVGAESSGRPTNERPSSQRSVATYVLAAFALIAVLGLIVAIFRGDDRVATSETAYGVDRIAAAPEAYYGKTVTIVGDVADVYGPRMFTLDEDTVGASADLLVLVKDPMPGAPEAFADAEVTVTGTVRKFTRAELARDYDWIDEGWFAGRDLTAAEQLPVVVAESASIG